MPNENPEKKICTITIECGEPMKIGLYQANECEDWAMRDILVGALLSQIGIEWKVKGKPKMNQSVIDYILKQHNDFIERVHGNREAAKKRQQTKRERDKLVTSRECHANVTDVSHGRHSDTNLARAYHTTPHHITPVAPSGGESVSQDEETSWWDWWRAYPKKVGQDSARRTWHAVFEDLPPVEKMLAALKWQSASEEWTRENGRFIPSASTYLSDGRWKDEPSGGPAPAAAEVQPVLSPDIAELERVMAERRRKEAAQ